MLSGSYGVLLGGPGIANAIGATLTANISALITLSVRRRAAEAAAMQVDANVIWQEWQTISQAQTLAIDLVEQDRLLGRLSATLALLRTRGDTATRAVAQGNATLQTLAPFVAELTALQTEHDIAALAQERRRQELDALLGLEPSVRPLLSTKLPIPAIPAAEASRLLATLPQRRPDLIALQLGYQSQEAGLRGAVLGQFPTITLGPNYGNDTSRVQTLGPGLSVSREHSKALLRCMIDKVVLRRTARDTASVRIVWRSGEVSEVQVALPLNALAALPRGAEIEARVVELARAGVRDPEIVQMLTAEGHRSTRLNLRIMPSTVRAIRLRHGIKVSWRCTRWPPVPAG